MTAVLDCARETKNKIEVRSVTSKWHSMGPVLLARKGGEHTCFLFVCFLRVDFLLVLLCCGAEKEALRLSEKWCCDCLRGPRPVPGALSRLPTAARADPGCLGENGFLSNALGWADLNQTFMDISMAAGRQPVLADASSGTAGLLFL